MMRTSNPALSAEAFQIEDAAARATMTLEGTATKTLVLLGIVVVEQTGRINAVSTVPGNVWGYLVFGAIAGLIAALVTIFKPAWSPVSAPIYAAFEGCFLGAFSAMFEYMYSGIVLQAVTITFGILASMLLAYRFRLVRATENFKLGVLAATGGICLVYLVSIIFRLFGGTVPFIHETGLIGIGFSVFVVVIASLNLVLDFDFIESGVDHGAPKYMEWYAGFGLLVTLVWLYIEIVRLLAKLRSRD
jgi:uncharacterized YccA/Bax inhibitor family protein